MRVRRGDRTYLEARARAAPADSVMTADYYTQLPQIRLAGDVADRSPPDAPVEVSVDDIDVGKLVECALRHPVPNMRYAVLAAIWNHADSFRQIFRFGLEAPASFSEIRKVVAEELAKSALKREPSAADPAKPAAEALLPRMPLPAHLRGRERQ